MDRGSKKAHQLCIFWPYNQRKRSEKLFKYFGRDVVHANGIVKNAQNCHQRLYEQEALKMFCLVHSKHELEQTGIFIDKELSYLGTFT